ncbi:MAG: hypothetical protein UT33_C0011G0033 [Candidatus Peregrinibacteria bacterium GW2011_GWC2_39_14]|nr:MAG: hypothetical protein UT33_C0011G0033 [Candidatus Peregrinibacteria bacterium GW2011_GWC2_39_14]
MKLSNAKSDRIILYGNIIGGVEGNRTPDLLLAKQAL